MVRDACHCVIGPPIQLSNKLLTLGEPTQHDTRLSIRLRFASLPSAAFNSHHYGSSIEW